MVFRQHAFHELVGSSVPRCSSVSDFTSENRPTDVDMSAIELVSDPAYTAAFFLTTHGHYWNSGYASYVGAGSVRTRSHLLGGNRLEFESPGGDRDPIEIAAPISPAMLWSRRWGLRIDKGCGRQIKEYRISMPTSSPLFFSPSSR